MIRSFPPVRHTRFRPSPARRLADRSGRFECETLERREVLALSGVALAQLPLATYDATGVTTYDAGTGALDINATPLAVRLSPTSGNRAVAATHGDFQIHARIGPDGSLLGGAEGDDFVVRGGLDLDGNGTIDPGETGDLLRGEIYAFGFAEQGATDRFDFRFVPTGGLLLPYYPAGSDVGVVMTAEASTFDGTFTSNFVAGAKGNYGPIAAPAPSSLAGTVYCDNDASGSLSAADAGLQNVDVSLTGTDHAGRAVDLKTKTAADGTYSFTGLRPGTYRITEASPADTAEGTNTVGTAGGVVVDADSIGSIRLGAGVDGAGYNFGYVCLVSISGNKYLDLAGDGLTSDDAGLAGTVIFLDLNGNNQLDGNEASTTTGQDGAYAFTGLLPGSYSVREVVATGFQKTAPTDADGYDVTLAPGQAATKLDFANAPRRGSIAGRKFEDATGNGLTADDSPLGGTTIYIDANDNGLLDDGERQTVTAADGTYLFDGLDGGSYVIREVVPAGYVRTGPVLTDRYIVTLAGGESAVNIDFCNAEKCDKTILTGITYSINGTRVVTDLRGNTNQGDVVTVTFTVRPGREAHPFTLVSYTAPGATFVAQDADEQRIYDIDTGVFGPGTWQLTVTIPDSNYQIDFVCGEAIDQFGPAGSNIFYSPQMRLFSADNDGTAVPLANPSSIAGVVFLDDNNNGVRDANEMAIQGAKVTVSWTVNGQSKSVSKYTDAEGRYVLGNLRPGVYSVVESAPSGFSDGKDTVGSAGGTLANDRITGVNLGAGVNAVGYNFGERNACDSVGTGDTAAVSFWVSTAGGNLIRSLNGGSTSMMLGFWLGGRFPSLFGAQAGSLSLQGKSNSQIASEIVARSKNTALNLETQVLATALSAYVTNSAWAGGAMASSYGFAVNLAGSGLSLFNVGSTGVSLNLLNGTQQKVLDIISGAGAKALLGVIYGGNAAARAQLYQFFVNLNSRGGIA